MSQSAVNTGSQRFFFRNVSKALKQLPYNMVSPLRTRYYKSLMGTLDKNVYPSGTTHKKILFWVPGGMPLMLHVEGAIAVALKLRGADVHVIICDGPFNACIKREITDGIPISEWPGLCSECKEQTHRMLERLNLSHSYIGDYITAAERKKLRGQTDTITWDTLKDLYFKNISLEKNVKSAVYRYLKGNDLDGHEDIIREYAYSALVCAGAADSAYSSLNPEKIFMSTGTYVDYGPALQIAFSREIPITAWMASYLNSRFYFRNLEDSRNLDFHNISKKYWSDLSQTKLSLLQNGRIKNYLDKRYRQNISFDMKNMPKYSGVQTALSEESLSPEKKPVWGIFCHINWDAVSDYSPMIYPTFNDWISDTIREISTIPDVQWLVKIHPAESWDNPESGIQRLIEKKFPSLPNHIRIIRSDEKISPLDFYALIDGGVTVYGTPGLELALQGKPVILAGEAHYGQKGFTFDGLTRESYRQYLHQAGSLKPLDKEQRELALRYAYCYFIQRQIPMPVVKNPRSAWWEFQFGSRDLLLPGKDPFMDFICDKIITGEDFIMDENLVGRAEKF